MAAQYQFDFSGFTIGHLVALSGRDNAVTRFWAIHELTIGGVYHLPVAEMTEVLTQFANAYDVYVQEKLAKMDEENGDVRDMLDGIEGL